MAFIEESLPLRHKADELRQRKPLNDTSVSASPEMFETYRQLRRMRRERYLREQQIRFLDSKIQVAIGDAAGMQGVASWKWVSRPTLDIDRLRAEQEALYQAYLRESGSRRFCLDRVDLGEEDHVGGITSSLLYRG